MQMTRQEATKQDSSWSVHFFLQCSFTADIQAASSTAVCRHCLLRHAPLVTSLAVPAYELGSSKCGVPGDGSEFPEVEIIGEWNLVADLHLHPSPFFILLPRLFPSAQFEAARRLQSASICSTSMHE
jgi:hypothetical protein